MELESGEGEWKRRLGREGDKCGGEDRDRMQTQHRGFVTLDKARLVLGWMGCRSCQIKEVYP